MKRPSSERLKFWSTKAIEKTHFSWSHPGLKCFPQRWVPSLWMRGAWCRLHAPMGILCLTDCPEDCVCSHSWRWGMFHPWEEWCYILEKSDVTFFRWVTLHSWVALHSWEEWCCIFEKSDLTFLRKVMLHLWDDWCYILEKSDVTFLSQGLRCLSEICVSRCETLRILRQWYEKCVAYSIHLGISAQSEIDGVHSL